MYIFEVRTINESGNDPNIYLDNLMAYYSFPKEKINVLKSVKLKQQDVSSEVLVILSKRTLMNIFTNLIRRIHRLCSFVAFSGLGNAKNWQVWLTSRES